MAQLKVTCNCNQRQLNAALESELLASKEVNVLQILESSKSLVYTNLLQDEIEKLKGVVEEQQEELNRRQYLSLSHDDIVRNMMETIMSLKADIKSSEFIEKQNVDLYEKVQLLKAELSQSNSSVQKCTSQINQMRDFKDVSNLNSIKSEASFTVQLSDMRHQLKDANLRIARCDYEKNEIAKLLSKKEQSFKLREELLLDQIARLKKSKYESLDMVNKLTDRYHSASDSIEAKDHIITVSNLRNAVYEHRQSSKQQARSTAYPTSYSTSYPTYPSYPPLSSK